MPSILRPSSTCLASFRNTGCLGASSREGVEEVRLSYDAATTLRGSDDPVVSGRRRGRSGLEKVLQCDGEVGRWNHSLGSRQNLGCQFPTPYCNTEISQLSAFTASRTLSRSLTLTSTPTSGRASHGFGVSQSSCFRDNSMEAKPRRRPSRQLSAKSRSRPSSTSPKSARFFEEVLEVQSIAASSCAVSTLAGTSTSTLTSLSISQDDLAPSSIGRGVSSSCSSARGSSATPRCPRSRRPWTTGAESTPATSREEDEGRVRRRRRPRSSDSQDARIVTFDVGQPQASSSDSRAIDNPLARNAPAHLEDSPGDSLDLELMRSSCGSMPIVKSSTLVRPLSHDRCDSRCSSLASSPVTLRQCRHEPPTSGVVRRSPFGRFSLFQGTGRVISTTPS